MSSSKTSTSSPAANFGAPTGPSVPSSMRDAVAPDSEAP